MFTWRLGALLLSLVLSSACSSKAPSRQGAAEAAPSSAPLPAASSSAKPASEAADALSGGPPRLEDAYEGSIDPSLDVVMRLRQDGRALSGSYVYESKGGVIDLAGTFADDGAFTLKESVGGKATGSFSGRVVSSGNLVGLWSDADDKNPRAFHLKPISRKPLGPARVVKRVVRYRMKPVHRSRAGVSIKECTGDVTIPEVLGLGSAAVEAKIDEALKKDQPFAVAPTRCEDAMEAHGTFEVHLNRSGVLSTTVFWDEMGAAEAHPARGGAAVNLLVETGEAIRLRDVLEPKGMDKVIELLKPEIARRAKGDEDVLEQALRGGDFVLEDKGIRFIAYFRLPHAAQALDEDVGMVVEYGKLAGVLKTGSKASAVWKP